MKIEIERDTVQQALEVLEAIESAEGLEGIYSWKPEITALREALAAPNSVEFDAIETQPAHRGPVATFDEVFDAIDWDVWRMQPIRELVRMIHGKTAPQPATQQAPDALHLAAMDLARTQAQRIADLEQQLAAQQDSLTDEQIDEALLVWCGSAIPEIHLPLYRDSFRKALAAAQDTKGT